MAMPSRPAKAGKEIGIRKIELPRVRAVDFQNAKRVTFAAPRDENVDSALDAVLRQQFRRSKAGFFLKAVGYDDLAGMERIAGEKAFANDVRNLLQRQLTAMQRKGEVRARAYELWEQAGRPSGRDQEFWFQAEGELKNKSHQSGGA
jgi:hypothetical protein